MTARAAVIGGGPAGLMAAEILVGRGVGVDIYDSMPSLGRKFLMAGKSGLNLTHGEDLDRFLDRYGEARAVLEPAIRAFGPAEIRAWAAGLGVETFAGSSGRIFPADFKAAPLLRRWLHRLRADGAAVHVRHRWLGWTESGALVFETPGGEISVAADATVLALGGGSWPRLGSDAAWVPVLERAGIAVTPMRPANSGFDIPWSDHFREKFAGAPVKSVALIFDGRRVPGEFVVTDEGIESGAVYAHSAALRETIAREGEAILSLDLTPDRSTERLSDALSRPRGSRSMANHIRKVTGLDGVKAGLLRECTDREVYDDPARLAAAIKALPLRLVAPRPLAEAISSAGGVAFAALDAHFMLRSRPGVFCAGEMLDWEAPTGGYLFTACFATGRAAGSGAADWLESR
jgi:uncharacterized flavoprotein (TIGR03862 family)